MNCRRSVVNRPGQSEQDIPRATSHYGGKDSEIEGERVYDRLSGAAAGPSISRDGNARGREIAYRLDKRRFLRGSKICRFIIIIIIIIIIIVIIIRQCLEREG